MLKHLDLVSVGKSSSRICCHLFGCLGTVVSIGMVCLFILLLLKNSQMQRCSFYMEKKNANDAIIKSAFSDTFKVLSKMNISNITFILVSEWYLNITHGKCALCP